MKKTLCLILTVISLVTMMSCACAESWYCNTCNAERTTEYCPICGAHRPGASGWTCPTCGRQIPGEYNFCPDDRTPKTISDKGWPIRELNGSGTALKAARDRERRYQSFFGPGRHFPGAGAYKYYKVTSATALFREGDYVLVDLSYVTVGRRILYFQASSLTNASVDYVTLTSCPAVTTATIQPLFGPGRMYDEVDQNNKGVTIGAGTRVNVFFETNGWVFAEFDCALGTIRAWLPADQVN